jgi:hypothetical protein
MNKFLWLVEAYAGYCQVCNEPKPGQPGRGVRVAVSRDGLQRLLRPVGGRDTAARRGIHGTGARTAFRGGRHRRRQWQRTPLPAQVEIEMRAPHRETDKPVGGEIADHECPFLEVAQLTWHYQGGCFRRGSVCHLEVLEASAGSGEYPHKFQ